MVIYAWCLKASSQVKAKIKPKIKSKIGVENMTQHYTPTYKSMLERYQAKDISLVEFLTWARDWSETVLENWPKQKMELRQPYADLWLDLLNRFESSALFTEESCSFSQTDLFLAMDKWVQKVEAYIAHHSMQ